MKVRISASQVVYYEAEVDLTPEQFEEYRRGLRERDRKVQDAVTSLIDLDNDVLFDESLEHVQIEPVAAKGGAA